MKQEAEERARVIKKLEDEDKLAKELKQKKKNDLRQVIAKDKDAKMQHRNIGSQMERHALDFGENNVLSYVYEKKQH